METDTPSKHYTNESWSNYIHIRPSKLQKIILGDRKWHYIIKTNNNLCMHQTTELERWVQHRGPKGRMKFTIIAENFNTPLKIDRARHKIIQKWKNWTTLSIN